MLPTFRDKFGHVVGIFYDYAVRKRVLIFDILNDYSIGVVACNSTADIIEIKVASPILNVTVGIYFVRIDAK